MFISLYMELY